MITWNELVERSFAENEGDLFFDRVLSLRERLHSGKGTRAVRAACSCLGALFKDDAYRGAVKAPWPDLVDFCLAQIARSRVITLHHPRDAEETQPFRSLGGDGLHRAHHQLPCTGANRTARAKLAADLVDRNAPVVLLGDDDLVSVSLAQAAFSNVTAIDIDSTVLDSIQLEARQCGVAVRTRQCDLKHVNALDERRDHAMAIMDPPCCLEGILLFLSAAMTLTRDHENPRILLFTGLTNLFREGLLELERNLELRGLEIEAVKPAFAIYPVPARTRGILRAMLRLTNFVSIRAEVLRDDRAIPAFFVSDCLVLKRKAGCATP